MPLLFGQAATQDPASTFRMNLSCHSRPHSALRRNSCGADLCRHQFSGLSYDTFRFKIAYQFAGADAGWRWQFRIRGLRLTSGAAQLFSFGIEQWHTHHKMAYPPQIERLRSVLKAMPGVTEVEADHTPLQDIRVADLSLVALGDLPHAAIRRTSGGRPGEALGQVFITLSPTLESWRTLEFISWQVRDWSRAGRCIQIRTRALPPAVGEQIQLGSSLRVIVEFFVSGLDTDPERLLRELEEFAKDLKSSLRLYSLNWRGGAIERRAEPDAAGNSRHAV